MSRHRKEGATMLTVFGILLAVVGLLGLVGVLPLGLIVSIVFLVAGVLLALYDHRGIFGPRRV